MGSVSSAVISAVASIGLLLRAAIVAASPEAAAHSDDAVGIRNSDHAVDLQVRRTGKNVSGNFLIVARVSNRVRRSDRGLRKRRRDPSPFFPQDLSASDSGLKQPGCQWRPEHDSQTAEIDAARVPAGPMSNALVASVIWVFDPHTTFISSGSSGRSKRSSPSSALDGKQSRGG
jgi:hypothetical protein